MRDAFCQEMIALFKKKRFVFLTGDLGFKALEPLREVMGNHFINAGIAEQNMISTAAGIAKTGLPVFCYSIAPFIFARPFEQIRNDVCLHNLPVFLVGNGGGYGYGVMGATHHGIEDYGSLLCLQNMRAFVPAFASDIGAVIERIIHLEKPSYLRLGSGEKLGKKYAPWRKILSGDLGVLIITGAIAGDLLRDFEQASISARPSIWLLCELPLSEDLPKELLAEIASSQRLSALEEHMAQGGVGQMIAAKILAKNIAVKSFSHLHARGYVSGLYGSQKFHRDESGLTRQAVLNSFLKND